MNGALNFLSTVCSLAFHRTTLIGETRWKLRARRTAGRVRNISEKRHSSQVHWLLANRQCFEKEREMLLKALGGHKYSLNESHSENCPLL